MFFSAIEKFDIINFYNIVLLNFLDFSLTNYTLYLLFSLILILILYSFLIFPFFLPSFQQILLENLNVFIFDIIIKQINIKGLIFFPFIIVLFLLILIFNLMGLLPFSFPITSHLVVTFFFSSIVWFTSFFLGFKKHGFGFLKIFVPNVPIYLLPFLICIDIISYVIRIFSLALRLAANITSGHVLLFTLAGFSIKLIKLSFFVSFLLLFVLIFIFVLELGISFLQAYVFVTLTCIYLNDSINLTH